MLPYNECTKDNRLEGGLKVITLQTVTKDNFWDCIDLSVYPEQENFITSNSISIAQSKIQPEYTPLAIYNDETMVGFIMYCLDADDDEYWIYRLMIDQHYQGKGFATEALHQVIEIIKDDKTRNQIFLGVPLESEPAVHLYEQAGFKFNGQIFGQEHIMVLNY